MPDQKLSDCGVADLTAAILGINSQKLRYRLGLPSKYRRCLNCDRLTLEKIYCSRQCFHEYSTIQVVCSQCGTLFPIRKSQLIPHRVKQRKTEEMFCSTQCYGKWTGIHHGFGIYPEHRKGRKWDYDIVWQEHLATGYGSRRLSRILKIPEPTISVILKCKRKETKGDVKW